MTALDQEKKMDRLINGLELLNQLLPQGSLPFAFRVLLDAGVEKITFKDGQNAMWLLGVPGACNIERKQIDLDLGMDTKKAAEGIYKRHLISVNSSEEVALWILFHECGHIACGLSQEAAERFALQKFLEFKKSKCVLPFQ